MKKWLIGGVVVIALGAIVIASMFDQGESGKKVRVGAAELRTISSRVKATGEITPEKKVAISAKVVGEIIALPVREGQTVRRGQVLLELERDLYESARDRSRAALRYSEVMLERLKIQLTDAERTLRRVRELHANGFIRQEELDAATLGVDTANVDLDAQRHVVEQQQSALESAEEDLSRTTIRSPMDGVLIQLNAERGETVVPGTTNLPGSVIMTIADMSRLLAEVEVGEVDIVELELGQQAEITLDALKDETLDGRVVEIATSGQQDPSQGVIRFDVKIAIDDPHPGLRPSMTAKVNILTATREDVVSVPIQSVIERKLDDDGKEVRSSKDGGEETEVVYVIPEGEAEIRTVKTGISDELHVEIVEGLDESEQVVVGPYRTLKGLRAGDAVQIEEEDADEAGDQGDGDDTEDEDA